MRIRLYPSEPSNALWARSARWARLVALWGLLWADPASAQYTTRFTTFSNGAVTFTGNALGLDGETGQNGQGTRGSIATFITTNTGSADITPAPTTAPQFPFGTTSDWRQNGSQAQLRLPAGARVLYAELVWGGTFAGNTAADNTHRRSLAVCSSPLVTLTATVSRR